MEDVAQQRSHGKALDALGGPIGTDFRTLHTPDFFRVGLEESPVEAFAETIDQPAFQVFFVLLRKAFGMRIGAHAEEGFPKSQLADRIDSVEGIAVEMAVVENTGEAGANEKVFGQNIAPHLHDNRNFGEEAMPPNVKKESFIIFCSREAAGLDALLKYYGVAAISG